MSDTKTLGAQMLEIVDLHDLTNISFTAYKPEGSGCSSFHCHMHHEKLDTAIHGVTFGYGDTLQAAYEHAAHNLDAARAPKLEQAA